MPITGASGIIGLDNTPLSAGTGCATITSTGCYFTNIYNVTVVVVAGGGGFGTGGGRWCCSCIMSSTSNK